MGILLSPYLSEPWSVEALLCKSLLFCSEIYIYSLIKGKVFYENSPTSDRKNRISSQTFSVGTRHNTVILFCHFLKKQDHIEVGHELMMQLRMSLNLCSPSFHLQAWAPIYVYVMVETELSFMIDSQAFYQLSYIPKGLISSFLYQVCY